MAKIEGRLTFSRCQTLIEGNPRAKKKGERTLAGNTVLVRETEDCYSVRFHGSSIIRFNRDGSVILDSHGYQSRTTKERINEYSGVSVYQSKFIWYVGELEFYDGMNVGIPRSEKESLEQAARQGDSVAKMALSDLLQGI